MRKITMFLVAAGLAAGCGGNPCEDAGDRVIAKYEECGIDLGDGGDGEDAECTDEAAALAECSADCIEAADCGALDGTDTDAAMDYAECATACVS